MILKIRGFIRNANGATAIEYGLIAALIAVAAITGMKSLGGKLQDTFINVSESMGPTTAAEPAPTE